MSFDLSWFTTISGMFITGGVILLIIAFLFSTIRVRDLAAAALEYQRQE